MNRNQSRITSEHLQASREQLNTGGPRAEEPKRLECEDRSTLSAGDLPPSSSSSAFNSLSHLSRALYGGRPSPVFALATSLQSRESRDTSPHSKALVRGRPCLSLHRRFAHALLWIALSLQVGVQALSAAPNKAFPEHWGEPPMIQTRDYVEWPGGYGQGSGTVAQWISQNMEKDKEGGAAKASVLYSADFSPVKVGELPEDFMVLNGEFAVREVEGVKLMELPGTPLDSYVVMFGPAGNEDMTLAAEIQASSKGRRHPAFSVGLNGLGGYRLKVSPAKRALELFRGPEDGGETVATAPFKWNSGEWVVLRLQVRKTAEDEWRVEGKAWMRGTAEPTDWMVSHLEKKKPLPGRPFVAASPFSGTPIRFKGLVVSKVGQ